MTIGPIDLSEARGRIQAAFDPELLRAAGHQLADALAAHMVRVQASGGAVLNWKQPPENISRAAALLDEAERGNASATDDPRGIGRTDPGNSGAADRSARCDAGRIANPSHAGGNPRAADLSARFGDLVQIMLERGLNLHDPRYIGHQVPAPVPVAGLFDAVGSVTNQVMAIYEMGPWASSVEQAMVQQLGELIGWKPGEFSGTVTHGGSLANLTALLTARNVALPSVWEAGLAGTGQAPVLVVHAEAHYSVTRSAGILGVGTHQIVRADLDERRKIDPGRLDQTLQQLRADHRPIVAVAACACATPIGAFDPLDEIADVCRRHGVWLQ